MARKIIQLIPNTTGQFACINHGPNILDPYPNGVPRPYYTTEPVICWALVDDNGKRSVVGMIDTQCDVLTCVDDLDPDNVSGDKYPQLSSYVPAHLVQQHLDREAQERQAGLPPAASDGPM